LGNEGWFFETRFFLSVIEYDPKTKEILFRLIYVNQKPPTQFAQAVGLCYYFPNDTRRNRIVHVEALRDGSPAGLVC